MAAGAGVAVGDFVSAVAGVASAGLAEEGSSFEVRVGGGVHPARKVSRLAAQSDAKVERGWNTGEKAVRSMPQKLVGSSGALVNG